MLVDYLVLTPEQDDAHILEACENYIESLAYVYLKYDETKLNELIKCLSSFDANKEPYIREVLYSQNQSAIKSLFNAIKIQMQINSFTEEYVRINGMPTVEIEGENDTIEENNYDEEMTSYDESAVTCENIVVDSEELVSLREKVETLTEENETLKNDLSAMKSENDILQKVSVADRQDASQKLIEAEEKIQDLNKSIESLAKDLEISQKEIEEYRAKLSDADVDSLLKTIESLRQDKTVLKLQLDEKNNLIEKLAIANKAPNLRVDDVINAEIMTKAYKLLLKSDAEDVKTILANIFKGLWNDEEYQVASILVNEYFDKHIALHPINGGDL